VSWFRRGPCCGDGQSEGRHEPHLTLQEYLAYKKQRTTLNPTRKPSSPEPLLNLS